METLERTAANPARGRLLRHCLAVLLLGGTTLVALHDWLGVGAGLDVAIGNLLYDAVVLGAGVACLVRASDYAKERWAWTLIGVAILLWGAGEVHWTAVVEGNPSAPYPSLGDALYLAFYPLAYAGLALLVRARAHELNWRLWMDGAIAALGTAALGTAFVFDFVAEEATGTVPQVLTTLAYPLGDIAMVALVVGVVALTGWRPGHTWSLLLAGLSALAIADIAFTLQSTSATVPTGDWIDPIYLLAATCLAGAVWRPTRAAEITAPRNGDRRREIVVPAVFAGVMIGLFAMQYFSATSALSTVLWTGTMTAVIVRLAISDRENKDLLEQVRTDSLTGLGNRGRLEVDLEDGCDRATAKEPALLCLFDLNGFKRFNDTFGHPAGDALLERLGRSLRFATGADGSAYRIGGDEFCLLLRCPEHRFDAVVRRAADALSSNEHGLDVAASWGAATIPDEAANPAAALQLADLRMYAQKERGRGARHAAEATPPVKVGPWQATKGA